jgi:hypothetical protein
MPSVRAISDQTGFIDSKLTNRRLIAARIEGSRATLSVPRSSVVAAHSLHGCSNGWDALLGRLERFGLETPGLEIGFPLIRGPARFLTQMAYETARVANAFPDVRNESHLVITSGEQQPVPVWHQ